MLLCNISHQEQNSGKSLKQNVLLAPIGALYVKMGSEISNSSHFLNFHPAHWIFHSSLCPRSTIVVAPPPSQAEGQQCCWSSSVRQGCNKCGTERKWEPDECFWRQCFPCGPREVALVTASTVKRSYMERSEKVFFFFKWSWWSFGVGVVGLLWYMAM